jgi:hypothetical protein
MKLCIDCKYIVLDKEFPEMSKCGISTSGPSVCFVLGKTHPGTMHYCQNERKPLFPCGPDGLFFEKKS